MTTEQVLSNMAPSVPNLIWEQVTGGVLVIALGHNGEAIALTFIPERA